MTAAAAIEAILKYIAQNAQRESDFLTPRPSWSVEAEGLLLFIGAMGVLPESEVTRFFDAERGIVEAKSRSDRGRGKSAG